MGRWGLSAGVMNDKIYAIGGGEGWNGADALNVLSVVEEYDPATDTWGKKSDMPNPRAWMANNSPTIGGKIYVIGGWQNHIGEGMAIMEAYDPVTDTWTRLSDMPTARGTLGVCKVNSKIYAIGGSNWGTMLSTVEEYDPGFTESTSINPAEKFPTVLGEIKAIY
jgi:N-acetylneuraminic acid mutarotase